MKYKYIQIISVALMCFTVFLPDLSAQTLADSTLVEYKIEESKEKDVFDIIEKLFNKKRSEPKDTINRKLNFSVLPLSTEIPGGQNILLSSIFCLGDRNNTNLSEVWFEPYTDFKDRYGIAFRSNIWFKQNKWTLRGDMRFSKYSEYTWGIGKSNTHEDKLRVDGSYLRIYQSLLRQIYPDLFIGLGYNLDVHSNIHTDSSDKSLAEYTNYLYGIAYHGHSVSSGVNVNLMYNTRESAINPRKGEYINLEYRNNFKFLGSDHWWHSLYLDLRKYCRLSKSSESQNLIAFWSYFWTTFNSNPPYFDLPSIGWDSFNNSGRGFEQGRFRAKSLFYSEMEYRRDITRDGLLGFVLFVNINSLSGSQSKLFSDWNLGGGGGLRVKIDRESRTNISLDYAISRDYFTLGEYF